MKKIQKILLFIIVFNMVLSSLVVYGAENVNNDVEETDTVEEEVIELYKNYVVVIDPGHDYSHAGAKANGIREEKINLIIANACKEELEKIDNITVYLTHDNLVCPFWGTDASECNKKRCEFAASVNADYYISIHANYNVSRRRNGFEIIYPNTYYKPEYNEAGEALCMFIVPELKKTGMNFRNIWTRNSTENNKDDENFYPDGTRADYYNVIRNCKYHDILSIIIEHGYLSNWSDAKNYLGSEEKLKEFGAADARGLINYIASLEVANKYSDTVDFFKKKVENTKKYFKKFNIIY